MKRHAGLTVLFALVGVLLTVAPSRAATATLEWTPSTAPTVTNHNIYRLLGACPTQGPTELLATIGNVTSYVDSTVSDTAEGAAYEVTALLGRIESETKSNRACKTFTVTPPPPPPPPVLPTASIALTGNVTTVPYSGTTTMIVTGAADALLFDRGAPGTGWPITWPSSDPTSLARFFTKTATGWTFDLCLACYPAPGTYTLSVKATNAAGSVTATLPITVGTPVPPPPPPTTYTLTVVKAGTGAGTVAPAGGTYNAGTSVTITAAPDAGSSGALSGACTGSTSCTLTMDGNKTVTATFTLLPPPPPSGLRVTSATPDEVIIMAAMSECTTIKTSTAGTSKTQGIVKRTLTCVRP